MATVNSFKKLTVEERAEMKEKFADVSTQIFVVRLIMFLFLYVVLCTYVNGNKHVNNFLIKCVVIAILQNFFFLIKKEVNDTLVSVSKIQRLQNI